MPNLGTAAPKVVVKDAKGDVNKPTQWSERAPRIQREVLVQPKIPEKDAKGFASAKGAGRGKAKPVPTAADVSSARMARPGGVGRGYPIIRIQCATPVCGVTRTTRTTRV